MNVLWVSHFLLYPHTGNGALQRSRNLLMQVAARHETHLLSFVRSTDLALAGALEEARLDLERICRSVSLVPYPPDRRGGTRWRLALRSLVKGVPYSVLLYEWPELYERVGELVRKHRIDVVLADTLGLADRVLGALNVPAVLTHHNVESAMMLRRAGQTGMNPLSAFLLLEAWKLRRYERAVVPRYAANVVVSDLDAIRLRRVAAEANIAVVPNGVDCRYHTLGATETNRSGLLFVGPLDWYPNDDAVRFFCREIWPTLARRRPSLTLTIVGRRPSAALRRLADRQPRIRLTGFVPDARVYAREAKVSICPIRDGGGTRLKVLDAMAQGVPVVSTRLGCEGLAVEDGVHVLLADTGAEFVARIERLLDDVALWDRLRTNGRRLVEARYSFDRLGGDLAHVLEGTGTGRAEASEAALHPWPR